VSYRAATPLADLTEREFSLQVYDLLALLSWCRYHTWRSKHSRAGYPDESCWRTGDRHLWLELKREKGKLSDAQKDTIRGMLEAGDEVYVVRPSDLDDLAAVLQARGRVFTGLAFDAHQRLVERTRVEVGA
jgi:hypothetical protein